MSGVAEPTFPDADRSDLRGFWLYYLLFSAVVFRTFVYSLSAGSFAPAPYALMGGFLALSLLQPLIGREFPASPQVSLAAQTALVFALLLTRPLHDYYATLFIALSLPVARLLRGRDFIWMGIFCATLVTGLLIGYGWPEGTLYVLSYVAGVLFIGMYGRANRKAETARARSEELARQLQEANRRLRIYADQAEEAATVHERARLARELHDAVTQTVFSMNLTAEAARIALDCDPGKTPALLDRLQELARDALGETRSMIDELRHRSVAEAGLVGSLERHLALRERRDGLRVAFTVDGQEQGGTPIKDALFRTTQEALNNVLRHSGRKEASVRLAFDTECASLLVRDEGRGFDVAAVRRRESFGLVTMRERAESLGGTFRLTSAPGVGTEIEVKVPIDWEPSNEKQKS